ncbi:MAG TPA: hypothetical protein VMV57_07440 [Terracidiphilus sp.]|nr:hypothetical protein [Terracidiphilus sp.]
MNNAAYQSAYDEASAELNDIVGQFEHLRLRKEKVEKAVEVLKVLAEIDPQVEEPAHASQEPSSYSFQQIPAPLPELPEGEADPFKRRAKGGMAASFFGQGREGFQQAV